MYDVKDIELNMQERKREMLIMLLCASPFIALLIAGFVVRIEAMAIAGCLLAGSVFVFLGDLRVGPVSRYGRYLLEINSGLQRETVGALVRVGCDPVYTDGVDFYEVIINIYEDMSEEGERRFLLDCKKQIDETLIGQDVIVKSHGNYVLGVTPIGA